MSEAHDPRAVAEDAVAAAEPIGVPSVGGLLNAAGDTLLQGRSVARASVGLAAGLGRVVLGRSEVAPARGDWRFKDPTWTTNSLYKRLAQGYLAACEAVEQILDDM